MGQRALDGVVFDLDGVVTRTAALHAESWKRMFDEYLRRRAESTGEPFVPFTLENDYRMYVDGRPRIDGVETFLKARGIELPRGKPSDSPGFDTAWALGNLKNEDFNELVRGDGVEILEGTVDLIHDLRSRGIHVGVASSSKNCSLILQSARLDELFETQVDGVVSSELGLRGKPEPDIFLEAARRMRVSPENCAVVEDATSGVQAGRAGGFGLVIGLGPQTARLGLREYGADWIVESFDSSSYERMDAWFKFREHRLPSALGEWDRVARDLDGREAALFLDYDGTLTPIVARPDLAVLDDEARNALRAVAQAIPSAIISGRGRADVEALVGIEHFAYAGSHGFDIVGRHGETVDYEIAEWIEPLMDQTTRSLEEALREIPGSIVEPKGFSVAAHYRLVPDQHIDAVEAAVDACVASDARLRKSSGKKVFEIRPDLDWDKGRALLVLLEALGMDRDAHVPIYIGDDVTDEDAFRVLADRGIGILVAESPRPSSARFWLQDPLEVYAFLDRLRRRAEGGSS